MDSLAAIPAPYPSPSTSQSRSSYSHIHRHRLSNPRPHTRNPSPIDISIQVVIYPYPSPSTSTSQSTTSYVTPFGSCSFCPECFLSISRDCPRATGRTGESETGTPRSSGPPGARAPLSLVFVCSSCVQKGSAMPVLLFLAAAAAIAAPHCFFSLSFLSEFQMWERFCFPSVESVNFWSFRTSAASVNLVCCRGTEGGSSSVERERRVEWRRRERR